MSLSQKVKLNCKEDSQKSGVDNPEDKSCNDSEPKTKCMEEIRPTEAPGKDILQPTQLPEDCTVCSKLSVL